MSDQRHFIAIDLGASSGRVMLGTAGAGTVELRELSRFANPLITTTGQVYWDFLGLYQHILEGLKRAAAARVEITSIGIDTWGVDFACFAANGELLGNPRSYRDPHTAGAQEEFFRRIPRKRIYQTTGIQFMDFNSLFQLAAMRRASSPILAAADKILFMPDAFSCMLTGEMVCEYTIASTSQLLDARARRFDPELLAALELTEAHFGRPVWPGETIGTLNEAVQRQTGLGAVPVIAVAGHDTASAVAAVPASSNRCAYLSSGTWSLMGIESDQPIIDDGSYRFNFTNEGGLGGKICFLQNICGLWLLERCRAEWAEQGEEVSYEQLAAAAAATEPFAGLIDPDDPLFVNPASMLEAIGQYLERTDQNELVGPGEVTRAILESLAYRYNEVLGTLGHLAGYKIEQLHIIGGGSQNDLLNQFTANATAIPVIAGPAEATAIGNVMVQALAAGIYPDRESMRAAIRQAVSVRTYNPVDQEAWDEGFVRYCKITCD